MRSNPCHGDSVYNTQLGTSLHVFHQDLWRSAPDWRATVEKQVQLPLRWGGMGLRPMREVAPAAYLGSWALVLPTVQTLVGGAPLLGPAAAPSASATAVAAAEDDWRGLTNQARTAVMATDGLPKQQRVLSQALDRARRDRLRNSASPEDWMRIQACAGTWGRGA